MDDVTCREREEGWIEGPNRKASQVSDRFAYHCVSAYNLHMLNKDPDGCRFLMFSLLFPTPVLCCCRPQRRAVFINGKHMVH